MKRTALKRKTPLRRRPRKQRVVGDFFVTNKARLAQLIESLRPLEETTRMLKAMGGTGIMKAMGTRYSRRARDWDRMDWIKRQPCALARPFDRMPAEWIGGLSPCPAFFAGDVEAHHAGVRGLGQKAGDDTCIPLCSFHHGALTDRRVPFRGWPRGAVKTWELAMVAEYRRRYDEHLASLTISLY